MARKHVNAGALNVRSSAVILTDNIVVSLPFGHPLDTTGDADLKRWIPIETNYGGTTHKGFVNVGYLRDSLSPAKERLVSVAAEIWDKFDRGEGKEDREPYSSYVAEMWDDVYGKSGLTGKDKGHPWASAFITFILRQADYAIYPRSFPSSRLLYNSIAALAAGSVDREFEPLRPELARPQIGDFVCKPSEGKTVTFDKAKLSEVYPCHCDLVVAKGMTKLWAVGGNVKDSVNLVSCALFEDGTLDSNSRKFIAVLKNTN